MSSYDDTATIPSPVEDAPPTPPPGPDSPAGSGWRQRMWGLRSVIAVALAGLLLGAAGGALLGYAAHSDDEGGPGRGGFGGPAGGFAPGQRGQFGQQNGQQFGQQFGQQNGLPDQQGLPGNGIQPGVPGQTLPSTTPSDDPQPDGSTTPSSTT